MRLNSGWGTLLAAVVFFAVPAARAQSGDPPPSPTLSVDQIVAGIQARSQMQRRNLKQYEAVRNYGVEYHGMGTLSARMQVEVTYNAGQGKRFRIVSQSGSLLLRDAVLKRAVDSEKEASKAQSTTALSPANYHFVLLGSGNADGRPVYILKVDPVKPQKYLYRGTIWVDAGNFGVVKIEAAPAKNPSMWISRTTIWVTNEFTNGFWLPQQTRSQTAVRVGGTATMTIDYGQYQIGGQTAPRAAQLLLPDPSQQH